MYLSENVVGKEQQCKAIPSRTSSGAAGKHTAKKLYKRQTTERKAIRQLKKYHPNNRNTGGQTNTYTIGRFEEPQTYYKSKIFGNGNF